MYISFAHVTGRGGVMTEQRGGSRVGLCASASKERVGAGKLQRFDCLLTGPVKSRLYSSLGDSQAPFWVSLGLVDRRKWSESHCSRGYLGCARIAPLFPLPSWKIQGKTPFKNSYPPLFTFTFTQYRWLKLKVYCCVKHTKKLMQ